jgi:MFS family permease
MASQETARLSKDTKMAMISQFLGFTLDAYDMALVLVMAPILVKVFTSPSGSVAWQYVVIVITYSITMAARPVGAAVFGHYGDKVGRKFLLVLTISGVGIVTFLAGLLPTYQQIGAWAYVLFGVLRLLMGVFFGGESAVGHTFAIEHAPSRKRGLVGGFVQSGFALGFVLASAMFAFISSLLGNEAMLAYGWRIAFMTGALPVIVAIIIRRLLPESPEFDRAKQRGQIETAPLFTLFKPPAVWTFLQVFCFVTGLFLTNYAVFGFLPNLLTLGGRAFDTTTYSLIYGFALFLAFVGYIFYGWLSDYTGRRRLTLVYCVLQVIFAIPCFSLLYDAAIHKDAWMAVVGITLLVLLELMWGMLPAYLAERFPTRRRATGLGLGYTSGAVLGGWFSVYVWWTHQIPFVADMEGQDLWFSAALIMMLGSVLTLISALFSPELKDLNLEDVEDENAVSIRPSGAPIHA